MATGLRAYVAVFLFRGRRVLLLRRAGDRRFAPGLWTGVGGRVALGEMADLDRAALREIREETGLGADDVRDLKIRVVLAQPEGGDIVLLVFYTARTERAGVGPCREGHLQWIGVERVDALPLIENARRALRIAIEAVADRRPGIRFGVCAPAAGGRLKDLVLAKGAYDLT